MRNEIQTHIKISHDTYVNDILGGITPDSGMNSPSIKKAWSYLKSLRSESTGVPPLLQNNRVCTSDSSRCIQNFTDAYKTI